MCDWSLLPAGDLGPIPFFGLQKDGFSCAVQPTGLLLCDEASTPSTVFAEVDQQLNEVRFGRLDDTTRVDRLQPCYWYDAHQETLCRQPITGEIATPVVLDTLRTGGRCTFAGGRYTSAPTPSVPDNVEDVVDLRLLLYILETGQDEIQQTQTILAKVPVDEDIVLDTYLSDSAHNGVLEWQTTDRLVDPDLFLSILARVRYGTPAFNGLAVLTMAVMPGSGDTRFFEVEGFFPSGETARLVRRHLLRRMDRTPATSESEVTEPITVAQEYVQVQTSTFLNEANSALRETWIEGLRAMTYGDIDTAGKRGDILKTLHAKMSDKYQTQDTEARELLRGDPRTPGHECSHEVHRLHMSPILHGACKDYTVPVFGTDGPVRTAHAVQGEGFILPIPPDAMQSDAWEYGTMPAVFTPPRSRTRAVRTSSTNGLQIGETDDVASVVDKVPDFQLLESLCVVLQGFPCNRQNMEKIFTPVKVGEYWTRTQSQVGMWLVERIFHGASMATNDDSMLDAVVTDWELWTYGFDGGSNVGNGAVPGIGELQFMMISFFPDVPWSWPDNGNFRPPTLNDDGEIVSWEDIQSLPETERGKRIHTGLIFNTLYFATLDGSVRINKDGKQMLAWVGSGYSSTGRHRATRRQALNRMLTFLNKGIYPDGFDCLNLADDSCLCLTGDDITLTNGACSNFSSFETDGSVEMYSPPSDRLMCDATAHQEVLESNRNRDQGGPMSLMLVVLRTVFPDLYARFVAFLSCRSVVDETPDDPQLLKSESLKGFSRPVVVHTARDAVCAELSNMNLDQIWERSSDENSLYVTSCTPTQILGSHNVLQLVYPGLASSTLRQEVCQRWGAVRLMQASFDPYATALKYQFAQDLDSGVDRSALTRVHTTISALPVKIQIRTETADLSESTNPASVHENYTMYEWFAMFDHTIHAQKIRIKPVGQDHVFQYTGFGQPLLTPARLLFNEKHALFYPRDIPAAHKFHTKWLGPFRKWIPDLTEGKPLNTRWLTPKRNHLPPSQREAAISQSGFDISPDFLAWRWNFRAMVSGEDDEEVLVERISQAEQGVADLTMVANGQCGWAVERTEAYVEPTTLQWTRDEDGRTYQIDQNLNNPNHVLYMFRD